MAQHLVHWAAAATVVYRGVRRTRGGRGLSIVARSARDVDTQHTTAVAEAGAVQLRGRGGATFGRLVTLVGMQGRGGRLKLLTSGLQEAL